MEDALEMIRTAYDMFLPQLYLLIVVVMENEVDSSSVLIKKMISTSEFLAGNTTCQSFILS
uniref:Uncharacterized protein n=1 Tax=Arundo donax TaxID=35708 RepID=A0A0A9CAL5_ARUDO